MATKYLSTTGNGTTGDNWTNAYTTWATAVAGLAAGDWLVVDAVNYPGAVAGIALTFPGTPAAPNIVASVTPSGASSWSAFTAGAQITTNNTTFALSGSFAAFGLDYRCTSASSASMSIGVANGVWQRHVDCSFVHTSGGSSSAVLIGGNGSNQGSYVIFDNPTFVVNNVSWRIRTHGRVVINGGQFGSGAANPAAVFAPLSGGRGGSLTVQGLDFSANIGTTFNIVDTAYGDQGGEVVVSDFRLPASWSGSYTQGTAKPGFKAQFYSGDNADTQYRFCVAEYGNTAQENASVYLTGSTTDGGNISDAYSLSANVAYPLGFGGRTYAVEVSSVGSPKTATIECSLDGSSTIPNNSQVWMELEFFGTSGVPLGKTLTNMCGILAFLNASPTTHASSSVSWTNLGSPNCKFKLEIVFTPQEAGYVKARVFSAMPSNTQLRVDPNITVT